MPTNSLLAAVKAPQHFAQPQQIEKIVVVVCMQRFFEAARIGGCIANAQRELALAVEEDVPVFLLETAPTFCDDSVFLGPGSTTLPELLGQLREHDDWQHFLTSRTAGAKEVFDAMVRRGQEPKVLRVFGVEADVNVLDSVRELLLLFPRSQVEVVQNACAAWTVDPWADFRQLPENVVLV